MEDDEPDAVQGMLEYLYTFQYPRVIEIDNDLAQISPDENMLRVSLQHLRLHSIAQKYLLFTLRDMAKERMLQQITSVPISDTTRAKLRCYFTFCSNVYLLSTALPSDDSSGIRELYSAIPEAIVGNWDWMVEQEDLLEMLEEMPGLALDVMKAFRKRLVKDEKDRQRNDRMTKPWGAEEAGRVGGYGIPNAVQFGYY